jgi:hypothetical protein
VTVWDAVGTFSFCVIIKFFLSPFSVYYFYENFVVQQALENNGLLAQLVRAPC